VKRSKKGKEKRKNLHLVPGCHGHMEGGKHELLVALKKNATRKKEKKCDSLSLQMPGHRGRKDGGGGGRLQTEHEAPKKERKKEGLPSLVVLRHCSYMEGVGNGKTCWCWRVDFFRLVRLCLKDSPSSSSSFCLVSLTNVQNLCPKCVMLSPRRR
jgi:hypothetical protein